MDLKKRPPLIFQPELSVGLRGNTTDASALWEALKTAGAVAVSYKTDADALTADAAATALSDPDWAKSGAAYWFSTDPADSAAPLYCVLTAGASVELTITIDIDGGAYAVFWTAQPLGLPEAMVSAADGSGELTGDETFRFLYNIMAAASANALPYDFNLDLSANAGRLNF
jgi:hypothetical protein